jgi:hypothetical protein
LNRDTVVVPREASSSLSIHSTTTGKTLSSGMYDETPISVSCSHNARRGGNSGFSDMPMYVVVATKRKGILQTLDVDFIRNSF